MNKRGFTLVEMISVLIILSVVALIVTPNIYVSIRDYKNRLYETQMDSIRQSGKNWAVDHIDSLPTSNDTALAVTIKELQDDGYIEDKLENPRDGGYFDNSSVFVLITCNYVEDETENLASNYKYQYFVYNGVSDYQQAMAVEYAKTKKITSNTNINTLSLKSENYISKKIVYTTGKELSVPNSTIQIKVTKSEDSKTGDTVYEYSAAI